MTGLRVVFLTAAIAIAASCSGPQQAPDVPADRPDAKESELVEEPPPDVPPIKSAMQNHFAAAVAIRDTTIAGDLEASKGPAGFLADTIDVETAPEQWRANLEKLRTSAATVRDANDLDSLAVATAELGGACNNCHVGLGVNRDSPIPEIPAEGDERATHMARHKWAADRLWEGLVWGDETKWAKGTTMIWEKPLSKESFDGNTEVAALGEKVHLLGKDAALAKDRAARVKFYGELLSTCANCHAMTKNK